MLSDGWCDPAYLLLLQAHVLCSLFLLQQLFILLANP
jgi:hypothetical protein